LQILLIFIISILTFGTANATVYWAAPNGIHDISGSSAFCQRIDSSSDQPGNAPSEYGTIGAAVACAKVAGDIVNIRGNMGVYNNSNNHRIKTDNPSITPSFGLASGTSSARTTVQGAPGDERPVINIPGWFTIYSTYSSPQTRRDYITLKYVKVDEMGIVHDTGGGALYVHGMYNTIDDVEVTRWTGGAALMAGYDSSSSAPHDCQTLHHLTIKNSNFHHAFSNGTGYNQYAIYYNGCDAIIEDNQFSHTIGGGIQIYYSVTANAPQAANRAIIRRNYIHDVQMTNIERPGGGWNCWGMSLDGTGDQVTRNIVDMSSCDSRTTSGSGIKHGYNSGSGNVVITNNIVFGTRSYPLELSLFNFSGVNYKVQNNILFNPFSTSVIMNQGNGVITMDHNACNSGSSCGSSMIPISGIDTCTESASNFNLKSGSPCIDKGVNVGEAFSGAAPDIGRFEYGAATTTQPKPMPPQNIKVQ
jgi:hypothetical protein